MQILACFDGYVLRIDKKRNRLEQERISQGWIINSLSIL